MVGRSIRGLRATAGVAALMLAMESKLDHIGSAGMRE